MKNAYKPPEVSKKQVNRAGETLRPSKHLPNSSIIASMSIAQFRKRIKQTMKDSGSAIGATK